MKSELDITASSPNKSFSSSLFARQITLRFTPSGSIFAKNGNKEEDS